ncbi:MAG: GYD domain-containing protein [Syntrophales bacterium]|jgi:uncharacterized protein with GYD domain
MPTYIVLMKLTEEGIKTIKNGPKRVKENAKIMEKMGGKMTGFYLTMGEYDYVSIGEAPNDETALTFLLGMGAQGFVKTTTLKAFTLDEYEKIVKPLP